VPSGDLDAAGGRWQRGPGGALFAAATADLGPLPLIVEDLGMISPAVDRLRERLGYPGMRVLQFAFDDDRHPTRRHRPQNITEGFGGSTPAPTTWTRVRLVVDARPIHAGLERPRPGRTELVADRARLGLARVGGADPAQDVLGLGSQARMNRPGRRRELEMAARAGGAHPGTRAAPERPHSNHRTPLAT